MSDKSSDHFDQKVEDTLRRDLPIITTPHAKQCLMSKGDESFTNLHDLNTFEDIIVELEGSDAAIKIVAMPGKHVPPGLLSVANDIVGAVPPTNGWMVELGHSKEHGFESGYR
jgi:hypothetical protein